MLANTRVFAALAGKRLVSPPHAVATYAEGDSSTSATARRAASAIMEKLRRRADRNSTAVSAIRSNGSFADAKFRGAAFSN